MKCGRGLPKFPAVRRTLPAPARSRPTPWPNVVTLPQGDYVNSLTVTIWASFIFYAKLPLYRQRRFLIFCSRNLPESSKPVILSLGLSVCFVCSRTAFMFALVETIKPGPKNLPGPPRIEGSGQSRTTFERRVIGSGQLSIGR